MYRVPAATCIVLLSAATAQASSIVTLPQSAGESPSIVALGSAEPPTLEGLPIGDDLVGVDLEGPRFQVGGSIAAFGIEAIPSAPVAVASIDPVAVDEPEEHPYTPMPFIIRGGVVGDAFSAPPAEEIELPEEAVEGEDPDAELSDQPG